MHDIVIVGAGPVGCHIAYKLTKKGFDVLVLEKNPQVGHSVVCTGIIGVEAFNRFNLPKDSILNVVQNVSFFSPSGNYFRFQPDSPQAFIIDRKRFDQGLANMALGQGAEFRFNSLVRGIEFREDHAEVEVESLGKRYELLAKMVILTCGFSPELTEGLGLGCPPDFLQGAQVEVEVEGVKETEVLLGSDIAPGSFAWIVPVSSRRARIGLTTRSNSTLFLQAFLNTPHVANRIRGERPNIRMDLIPLRPIPKSFNHRLLVAGEAAGQVKTTTHGGIYYGLISADLAVKTVVKAFGRREFGPDALKEYEIGWKDKLGLELQIGYRLRQIFSRLKDKQIDRLFQVINLDGICPIIQSRAQFDWHKDLILSLSKHAFLEKYLSPIPALLFSKGD